MIQTFMAKSKKGIYNANTDAITNADTGTTVKPIYFDILEIVELKLLILTPKSFL